MNPKTQAGFTLLELTTALVITSLIVLAAASGLGMVATSWERGERRMQTRETIRVISRRLALELASLSRGPFGNKSGLSGDGSGFQFTAVGDVGLQTFEIDVVGNRLVLSIKPQREPEQAREITLAEAIDHLECSYHDAKRMLWHDAWPENYPPDLIRLDVFSKASTQPSEAILAIYAGRITGAEGAGLSE